MSYYQQPSPDEAIPLKSLQQHSDELLSRVIGQTIGILVRELLPERLTIVSRNLKEKGIHIPCEPSQQDSSAE